MAKPEWGTKRNCQSCGAKFYDFGKTPIVCPKCEAVFEPEALVRSRRRPEPVAAKPRGAVEEEAVVEEEDGDEEALLDDEETEDEADVEEVPVKAAAAEDEDEDEDTDEKADGFSIDEADDVEEDEADVEEDDVRG